MNVAFAVAPALALVVVVGVAAIFWGRPAIQRVRALSAPLTVSPISWLAMLGWASNTLEPAGSYSVIDMWPLGLGAAVACVAALWLILQDRGGSAFFVVYALSNMTMALWVYLRAGIWLGSAL